MNDIMKEMGPIPNIFMDQLEAKLRQQERDLSTLSAEKQFELIASKVADHPEAITPMPDEGSNELLQRLKEAKESGKPLVVKLGVDPTGPDMHLGHAVPILMLRRFQQMGHKIQFVVGDFTAKIGDPSGRLRERSSLTDEQIQDNMKSYFEQAGLILDLSKKANVETVYNSEWLNKLSMQEWIPLLQKVSASQMFQREDFQQRLNAGGSISMAELMYALFMAYDSIVLEPDIEMGGMDQFLNLHWCRELMRLKGQKSEMFIVTDLLAGTSGEIDTEGRLAKMSKSKGNYIAITEEPKEMYGKVMSIPDEVMWTWYRELTEISPGELEDLKTRVERGEIHPMEAKRMLARAIVATFNGYEERIVSEAERAFNRKFGKEKNLIPDDIETIEAKAGTKIIDILSKTSGESKSNLRRMVSTSKVGGVRVLEENRYRTLNLEELTELQLEAESEIVVRVGKRRYYRIISKK